MAKILIVVGSQRANGFQAQLANEFKKTIGDRAEVDFFDYSEVPFVNQDIEFPAPASVATARDAFEKADGVWFVSPVYNDTYSPQVKNLLGWISRPVVANERSTAVSNGVKITFSSASAYDSFNHMFADAVRLAKFIGMDVLEEPLFGHNLTAEWATGELTLSDDERAALEAQVSAFLAKIG
ncbi:NADPH-dependent FMN reductase [Alloscardovia omnicolens]|uniref:NADPH-dependent FMN reductase n=1 Tax=Alloscardovia omnicolens TaxID=419015 RepID=UPI0006653480|nr:NAD(P)H-dependent oxidoreductase [Alloscardovia omnicolens]MDK6522412.1 NAD(P)H-dependent oxidoreductase [Alloscardovia omnicolens]MDK6663451.1 NAD(P)H-dependent oxidoreductase [Alloscardovia omnicolens]MDK7747777.1 NAD(P)H-dependent oxidoreductase [Alloscardovia omnicolens]